MAVWDYDGTISAMVCGCDNVTRRSKGVGNCVTLCDSLSSSSSLKAGSLLREAQPGWRPTLGKHLDPAEGLDPDDKGHVLLKAEPALGALRVLTLGLSEGPLELLLYLATSW